MTATTRLGVEVCTSCYFLFLLHYYYYYYATALCQSIELNCCLIEPLYSEGGASQPRSKHVSEGDSLRGVVPGSHVHASYAGE